MKTILCIVGSLRQGSYNAQLASYAEKVLEGQARVDYLDFSQVPFYNQDLENPVPQAVADVRQAVDQADAVWIFSPHINHTMPGLVKNLLDWLGLPQDANRPSVLRGKVVTVSSVATSGHNQLFGCFHEVLPYLGVKVVGDFSGARLDAQALSDGIYVPTADVLASLGNQAQAVLRALENDMNTCD